jgi:hypothetical protein
MKTAEFRGHTVAVLENLEKNDERLETLVKELDGKFDLLNEKITNMRIKVAGIGSLTGLIVALITSFVVRTI